VTDYYKKLVPLVYNQGPLGSWGFLKKLGLTVAGLFRPVPREPTSKAQMRTWAAKSAALACENLMLALQAAGYDTCPMEGLDSQRVKRILEVKSGSDIVMGIAIGKGLPGGIYGPRQRLDPSEFLKTI
jgi:nitroreductase